MDMLTLMALAEHSPDCAVVYGAGNGVKEHARCALRYMTEFPSNFKLRQLSHVEQVPANRTYGLCSDCGKPLVAP